MANTSRISWIVVAKAFHGNSYDGHVLKKALEQVSGIAQVLEYEFIDRGIEIINIQTDTIQVYVEKKLERTKF